MTGRKYFFAGVATVLLLSAFVLIGCEEETGGGGGGGGGAGPTLFDIYSIKYELSTQGIQVINVVQNGSAVTITLGGKIKSGHNGRMGIDDGTPIKDYSDVDGRLWDEKLVSSSVYEDFATVSLNGIIVRDDPARPNHATQYNMALNTYYGINSATRIANYTTEPPNTYLSLLLDRTVSDKNIMVNINDIRYTIDYKALEWDLESIYTVIPAYSTKGIALAARNGITQWGTTISIKLEGTIKIDNDGNSQNGKIGDNISIEAVLDPPASSIPMWGPSDSTALIDDFAVITFRNILVSNKGNITTLVNEAAQNYYNDPALFTRINIDYNTISTYNLDLTLIMDRTVINKVITIRVNGLTYIIDYNDVIWDFYNIYTMVANYSTQGIKVRTITQKVTSLTITLEGTILSNGTGNQNGKAGGSGGTGGTNINNVKDTDNTTPLWGPYADGVSLPDFAMITFNKIVIVGKPNTGTMDNQATADYYNNPGLASRNVNYTANPTNPALSLLLYKNAGYAEKIIKISINGLNYAIDYNAVSWAP